MENTSYLFWLSETFKILKETAQWLMFKTVTFSLSMIRKEQFKSNNIGEIKPLILSLTRSGWELKSWWKNEDIIHTYIKVESSQVSISCHYNVCSRTKNYINGKLKARFIVLNILISIIYSDISGPITDLKMWDLRFVQNQVGKV